MVLTGAGGCIFPKWKYSFILHLRGRNERRPKMGYHQPAVRRKHLQEA